MLQRLAMVMESGLISCCTSAHLDLYMRFMVYNVTESKNYFS